MIIYEMERNIVIRISLSNVIIEVHIEVYASTYPSFLSLYLVIFQQLLT